MRLEGVIGNYRHFRKGSKLPTLFPCPGYVTYSLLTRSPLSAKPKSNGPYDLHVLAMPPAFVLSQDQTLRLIFVQSGAVARPANRAKRSATLGPAEPRQAQTIVLQTRMFEIADPLADRTNTPANRRRPKPGCRFEDCAKRCGCSRRRRRHILAAISVHFPKSDGRPIGDS